MRVVVVGGGLGGLALASGLRRSGIDVSVVERDQDVTRTGGYHITLQQPVQQALAALLPADVFERILASAADGRLRDPDVMWDPRGRQIGTIKLKSEDPGIDIDRITLRTLLAEAAGDSLLTGREFTGFERRPDGTVTVHLDHAGDDAGAGADLDADLLVGADGTHSRIATALAGRPVNAPAGIVGISGRTRVADLDPAQQQRLGTRSSLGLGPHATALYFGYLDPVGHAVLDRPDLRGAITTEPTFIWGAMFRESAQTRTMARQTGTELRDATLRRFADRGWQPAMIDVIARTDPDTIGLFRFHAASENARDLAPWAAGSVTALGDAVHATPPTAGMGAGAAILDAHTLTQELQAVDSGTKQLSIAVRDFHADMRPRGASVTHAAMSTVRQILITDSPAGATLTRLALPILAGLTSIRRRG